MSTWQIELEGIAKSFGGVRALKGVSVRFRAGEVHAICGENGAGKSTLNNILSGSLQADEGVIRIDGKAVDLTSVRVAEAHGISIVHQESSAMLDLSATDNFHAGAEDNPFWLDRPGMEQETKAALESLGETFDVRIPLQQRSVAQRQMLAIARALSGNCRLLILDEPTSSLSSRETDALFRVVGQLRERGVAVLYVSHRLDEIFSIADRVTVLRDGELVETKPIAETTSEDLIRAMVGRDVQLVLRESHASEEVRLSVQSLCGEGFEDISFEVRAGEIVGLAGLIGAGRSEVARAIFGLDPASSGRVLVNGRSVAPNVALDCGVALVPEDRQHQGLHLNLSVRDNLSMVPVRGAMLINRSAEMHSATSTMERLAIKAASDQSRVSSLSGGNQQKVLIGKWLATQPEVLILDEPTRGVDVGAKEQIHRLIDQLAKSGVAILLISSELGEVLALSDRVLVMRQGRIVGELSRSEATQEAVLALALPTESQLPVTTRHRRFVARETGVAALLLFTILLATVVNPSFASVANVRDLLVRISPAAIVGVAMTLVILCREIDISVGSLMGLCAAALGIAASPDRMALPPVAAAGVCLAVGVLGGLFNGILVAYAKLPSIIVTLGTLTLFKGITELALAGRWVENLTSSLRTLGAGSMFGVPPVILLAILAALAGIWITRRTAFGLRIYAVGSNPAAARLRGIDRRRIQLSVFVLAGIFSGLAALFSATQLQVIESGFGSGFELVVIAAVIVGGTSIRGGRGTIVGTLLGAALLGIVSTVLIFLRLGESAAYWEKAIQGGFILLAVLGDHLRRRAPK